jgi:hypothetical protein
MSVTMNRIFPALLGLILLTPTAQCQYFSESFETGLPDYATSPNHSTVTSFNLSSGSWFGHNRSSSITAGSTGVFSDTVPANGGLGPFVAQNGIRYAGMNFENTALGGDINTFLMSPTRTFNNGDTISFFTRTVSGSGFPDRTRLLLSTNGSSTNSDDFTVTLLSINEALTTGTYPESWTQFTVTLSGLSGPTSGRFAFNYNVPDTNLNANYVAFDVVEFTPIPEPTTILGIGIGGILALRGLRRRIRLD